MKIFDIKVREILDSRAVPTVEVDMYYDSEHFVRASVPSGASTGSNEALELRDKEERFLGRGVSKAVNNITHVIAPLIVGKDFASCKELDEFLISLDGTENKSKLGANAILPVSLAFLKMCAVLEKKELYQYVGGDYKMPKCMMNILNGGMHADNGIAFQEFMIIVNRDSVKEQLQIASEVFWTLKKNLKELKLTTGVGDEGGFAPKLSGVEEALDLIVGAIKDAGYISGEDVFLALDVAASSFYDKEKGYLVDGKYLSNSLMMDMYSRLVSNYPIISIEDPFVEDDFESFASITKNLNIQIVGDDLFTTNVRLLEKGIKLGAGNAILIKANQIGTVSEMFDAINLAKENNYKVIISHRSGETEDTFIADLAVGLGLPYIKSGSVCRGERICKYNRLIRIEEEL